MAIEPLREKLQFVEDELVKHPEEKAITISAAVMKQIINAAKRHMDGKKKVEDTYLARTLQKEIEIMKEKNRQLAKRNELLAEKVTSQSNKIKSKSARIRVLEERLRAAEALNDLPEIDFLDEALADVIKERERQIKEHGLQKSETDLQYLPRLMEEVGEFSQAIQKAMGGWKPTDKDDPMTEITHVAAIALRRLEFYKGAAANGAYQPGAAEEEGGA